MRPSKGAYGEDYSGPGKSPAQPKAGTEGDSTGSDETV